MRSDDGMPEVDAMRRAHREASERLEDRPDASVRAAVLAAAARAVDARPGLVATMAPKQTPPSNATQQAPIRSRRWPLSAAALLVVSVLTGVIATQAMRDSPERITTVASSASPPQASKAEVPVAEGEPNAAAADLAASQAPAQDERRSRVVESPRQKTSDRESRRRDAERNVGGPMATAPVAPARSAEARAAPAAPADVAPPPATNMPPETPSPAAPSTARAKAVAPWPDSAGAQDATTPGTDARRAESDAFFQATNARNAARARVGRAAEPVTPEAWAERIVTLRAAGNDSEADRELDALRQRYPGFEIPAAALKASGTR